MDKLYLSPPQLLDHSVNLELDLERRGVPLDAGGARSEGSSDGGGSPQGLIALHTDKGPRDGGAHTAPVFEEKPRQVPIRRLVKQLHRGLGIRTLSARLEPTLGVVENRVCALEVLKNEVGLCWPLLDQLLAVSIRILDQKSLYK